MYSLLCFTILNRDLKIRVEKLEDLSADCHKQFLHLSQIAFEGILNEEVIFHTLPPDLVNFGFLDAVSALYGGARVSYNFLHLTLQEFFAAYHISHLGSSSLEVFKQHGSEERWNVVWRFVAGLTQFKHYKGHMDSDMFIDDSSSEPIISMFYIQCLFEARSINSFSLALPPNISAFDDSTALDAYALGFCISNFNFETSWSVSISYHWTEFVNGIKSKTAGANVPSVGEIHVDVVKHPCSPEELKVLKLLPNLTILKFTSCKLNNAGLISLSSIIPHVKNLSELCIINGVPNEGQDGLLKLLQQLSHSNLTSLNLISMDRYNSPDIYSSALKKLLDPSSGRLHSLHVSDSRLASIVSASSSLEYLEIVLDTNLSEHVPYLKRNSNLTKLKLTHPNNLPAHASDIAEIVKCNTKIQDLKLKRFNIPDDPDDDDADIAAMRTIVSALPGNNTLQSIKIYYYSIFDVSFMFNELTLDSRVKYKPIKL